MTWSFCFKTTFHTVNPSSLIKKRLNQGHPQIEQRPIEGWCAQAKVSALTSWILEAKCARWKLPGDENVLVDFQVMWEETEDLRLSLRVFWLITATP